jgi:hypothetical protein
MVAMAMKEPKQEEIMDLIVLAIFILSLVVPSFPVNNNVAIELYHKCLQAKIELYRSRRPYIEATMAEVGQTVELSCHLWCVIVSVERLA